MPARDVRSRIRVGRVAVFILVTFAFSWLQWLAVIASQHALIPFRLTLMALPIFGPLIGALCVVRGREERMAWWRSLLNWRIPPLPLAVALFAAPLLFAISLATAMLFVPQATTMRIPQFGTIATVCVGMFATAGIGEEPGWRGFLLPELRRSMSALHASLVVALTWFAWHLPLFWVAGSTQSDIPFAAFALGIVAYTFIITWVVESSSNSTLVAMLFHTSANVMFWLAMTTLRRTPQERFFTFTYVLAICAAGAAAAVALVRRERRERVR